MRLTVAIALVALIPYERVRGDESVEREMKQDVVLRALVDELERGRTGLKLEGLEHPYFIEYGAIDIALAAVSADLGAVARRREGRLRRLRTALRVGSYVLDNTNFRGDAYGGSVSMPIEDDYNALRQMVWWATDRHYKQVVEAFEKKKAFMKSKIIEDKPDDFSRESPVVHFGDRGKTAVETAPLERLALALSAVFKDFPEIQNSHVEVQGMAGNKYLVNTEGTRLRTAESRFSISVAATVQADDGMRLSDSLSLHARNLQDLPPLEELSERCREMAGRLITVKNAPTLDSYTGPVLFEPEAAAAIFVQNFGHRFTGGQRSVGSSSSPDDFEKKLERRLLPRFLNVMDDPTHETLAGVQVMAHYEYDDQGVKARPVTLGEKGRLKALLMSRNPSKTFSNSTGHGCGVFRPSASVGCLIVTATEASDSAALNEELLEACADEGLEYGLRIVSLGGASAPLVMHKVYADGREESARGAAIAGIDLRAFKRLLAVGDTPYVLNSGRWYGSATTASVPALLFEELDLAKVDRDFDKPPILPHPLARANTTGTE